MRFKKDPFVVERRYRLSPSLLKEGAAPDVDEQTLLVALQADGLDLSSKMIFLSDVAERMWDLLTEGNTVDSVVDVIVAEYEVDPSRAREDLERLIAELRDRRALVPWG
jgi:hypothetical protein